MIVTTGCNMTIITVTEYATMPGRYTITVKYDTQIRTISCDASGDGAAAAKAMEYAISSTGDYIIFGNNKVLAHIPAEMRSSKK